MHEYTGLHNYVHTTGERTCVHQGFLVLLNKRCICACKKGYHFLD